MNSSTYRYCPSSLLCTSVHHQNKNLSVPQVNGMVVVPTVTTISGVKIYLSGKFIVLETSFGLRVRFDGNHHADVTVPTSYNGRLCGMCGKNGYKLLVSNFRIYFI